MKDNRTFLQRLLHFITVEIWRIPLTNLSGGQQFMIRQIRIIILAFRGFQEDNLALRAASLTMYTLLSVVPLAAMAFGIAKGFGFEQVLDQLLRENFTGQEAVVEQVILFSNNLLDSTKGELIAGIGFIFLLFSVLSIFSSIEDSFNAIYDVKKPRTLLRKFSDYLTMMIVAPLIFIISSSITVFISTVLTSVSETAPFSDAISPVISILINLLPYLLISILFTLIYVVMPNTRVRFGPALTAGIIAGIAFTFVQWGYVTFQIGVSRNNAIYGSFAALPLFIIWLQISWLIVLIGAEIAYANQNVENFDNEADINSLSPRNQRNFSILLLHRIVKTFESGVVTPTTRQLAADSGLPIRLIRKCISDLTDAGLIHELRPDEKTDRRFIPALDINQLTLAMVVQKLENRGSTHLRPKTDQTVKEIFERLDGFQAGFADSDQNKLLKDIEIVPKSQ